MKDLLIRCLYVLGQKKVKWALVVLLSLGITAAHVVMYLKYGGTEQAPTLQLTLAVHTALALGAALVMTIYYKYLKQPLTDYERRTECTD